MANVFSALRAQLQTAAQGVAPFTSTPSQVVLGNYDWSGNPNFFKSIVSTGPWLFIKPSIGSCPSGKGPMGASPSGSVNATFTINIDLVYGFANYQNHDWTAEEQYIANLVAVWTPLTDFNARLDWSEPEVRSDLSPVVARTVFVLTMPFVSDQGNS